MSVMNCPACGAEIPLGIDRLTKQASPPTFVATKVGRVRAGANYSRVLSSYAKERAEKCCAGKAYQFGWRKRGEQDDDVQQDDDCVVRAEDVI